MRINSIAANYSNLYRNKFNKQTNNKNSAKTTNQLGISNSQKQSFGMINPLVVFAALEGPILAVALFGEIYDRYDSHVMDKRQKELEAKKFEEAKQESIDLICNKMNLPKEEAQRYHDTFLNNAYIPKNQTGHEIGLNKVMGYEYEKYMIAMNLIAPTVIAKDKRIYQSTVPNGLLLYGPTGSGKTYIAKSICEHFAHFQIYTTQIEISETDHEANIKNIEKAFTDAKRLHDACGTYTIIRFKDDIDSVFIDRNKNGSFAPETRTLMKYTEDCAKNGAIWIATANNPKNIDPAIVRRASLKLPIGNMKDFQIGDMLKYRTIGLTSQKYAETLNYQEVVDYIKQNNLVFTPDEYKAIVTQASLITKEFNEKDIIRAINRYCRDNFLTLDQDTIENFNKDQKYVSELDNNDKNSASTNSSNS